MMKRMVLIVGMASLVLGTPAFADLTVIDFDGLANFEVVDNQFLAQGVDFNATGRALINVSNQAPFSAPAFLANVPDSDFIRADSVGAEWRIVSTYLVSPFQSDATFKAFDSSDTEIGSFNVPNTGSTWTLFTFDANVLGSPIDYVIFANGGNDIAFDDFGIEPIPAPGAAMLGLVGITLVGWFKRRVA